MIALLDSLVFWIQDQVTKYFEFPLPSFSFSATVNGFFRISFFTSHVLVLLWNWYVMPRDGIKADLVQTCAIGSVAVPIHHCNR